MAEQVRDDTYLPPSFNDAVENNYLGSPDVVQQIIGEYIEKILDLLKQSSSISSEEFRQQVNADGLKFAAIFSGEDPDYKPVVGWNSRVAGLNARLRIQLGEYWTKHRDECENDPYRALYSWLVWAVYDAVKSDDRDIADMKMADRLQTLTRMLLGTDRRV